MTHPDKTYWIRKKGSVGPNRPFGILLGKHKRKKGCFWVEKPAIAIAAVGGEKLDAILVKPGNEDYEVIEVTQKGYRKYHKDYLPNWVPVEKNDASS